MPHVQGTANGARAAAAAGASAHRLYNSLELYTLNCQQVHDLGGVQHHHKLVFRGARPADVQRVCGQEHFVQGIETS